jgi:hypothetical protein
MNTTLYLTPDNARYFLVPDDKSLSVGDFVIRTIAGATHRNRTSSFHCAVLSLLEKRMARR